MKQPPPPKRREWIVVPMEIWLHKDLLPAERMLWAEITSLDATEKGCFASNGYFAAFLGCSETRISQMISHLVDLDLIERASFDGRRRTLHSALQHTKGSLTAH